MPDAATPHCSVLPTRRRTEALEAVLGTLYLDSGSSLPAVKRACAALFPGVAVLAPAAAPKEI